MVARFQVQIIFFKCVLLMKRPTTPLGGVLLITTRMQHGAEQLQIKEKKPKSLHL